MLSSTKRNSVTNPSFWFLGRGALGPLQVGPLLDEILDTWLDLCHFKRVGRRDYFGCMTKAQLNLSDTNFQPKTNRHGDSSEV